MGRIEKAFASKFRALLGRVGARRVEKGVQWLVDRAAGLSRQQPMPLPQALAAVYERTQQRIERWQTRTGRPAPPFPASPTVRPLCFFCDAGLGGLARWLRAAGYEAHWTPGIGDNDLLREARRLSAIVLTTDSLLMERRLLRDGVVPALWVPPTMTVLEQLAVAVRELRLSLREPRCMNCSGALRPVAKEAVRDRIPPRTYRWLDEYFVCDRCGKLFWHGTHWQNIRMRLQKLAE